ncbi:hypothetical protein FSP39_009249 [Pinctada imbricata]|uniref:Uncharacterized protein n=1 Tax=Pinctada imbricata TaxID=66713 RepID=A0AA88Y1X8_PINIB|nr:hypothetical protein FSP39_009249 [Pinctada imbricata]
MIVKYKKMEDSERVSGDSQQKATQKCIKISPLRIIPNRLRLRSSESSDSLSDYSIPEDELAPLLTPCSPFKKESLQSENSPIFKYFPDGTNLFRLKNVTTKLKLETRRQSFVEWRESVIANKQSDCESTNKGRFHTEFSNDKINNINSALAWAREELEEMRQQDQEIAQQLLDIHKSIQKLRLDWSCQEHQLMLEDAKSDLEEIKEIKRVSDLPLNNDQGLNQLGFTRMNISLRKYSIF